MCTKDLICTVQDNAQEVFVGDRNVALLLRVSLAESIRKSLDSDAKHDELVNRNLRAAFRIIYRDQKLHKLLAEAEAHLGESLHQLCFFNCAGAVPIVRLETVQPLVYVVEKLFKFSHINRAGPVGVEHRNHQFTGFIREIFAFSIHQRGLQFSGVNFSTSISVDLVEDVLSFRIGRSWLSVAWVVALKKFQ